MMDISKKKYEFWIHAEDFTGDSVVFIIAQRGKVELVRRTIGELFRDASIMMKFCPQDISKISFAAGVDSVFRERHVIRWSPNEQDKEHFLH